MPKRRIFTEQEELEIIEYYSTHTDTNTAQKYHVHFEPRILEILAKHNIIRHSKTENKQLAAEQLKKAILDKYGVENCFAAESVKEKIKQTNLKRYGAENPFQSDIIKEKITNTFIERYGAEHALQVEEFREKYKQTSIDRFGVDNISKLDEVKDQKKETLFKNFGQYHSPNTRYTFNNKRFDSFPELCFYLYHVYNNIEIIREPIELEFFVDNKRYNYYPDFKVNGNLIEIKGDLFLKEDGTWYNPFDSSKDIFMEAKRQCALKNNVIILYSEDYNKYID